MKEKGRMFLLLFIAGLVILLLPDNGKRIFSLNRYHGPSLQDLIGLAMMLVAWIYACIMIARNFNGVSKRLGKNGPLVFIAVYILSVLSIGVALNMKNNTLLWCSMIPAVFVNLLFIYCAFSKRPITG